MLMRVTFVAFPKIQDGGQKDIMRGKFKISIYRVKATVLSLTGYHAFF